MPNTYPSEFRRDVVQVARNREPGVSPEKIAHDIGIHPITSSTWLKKSTSTTVSDLVSPHLSLLSFGKPTNVFVCWRKKRKCWNVPWPMYRRAVSREKVLPARKRACC
jgi:hypothetical protein